jgi:demethylmenaquinone methyltransferase/2-methoxy-6-polyprenyl-1,4-benzoquinol methylase
MLARAEERARRVGRAVDLRLMDVTDLDLPDRSVDAAVASFLFCVLPDEVQVSALRETARVLKPGGRSGRWSTSGRPERSGPSLRASGSLG